MEFAFGSGIMIATVTGGAGTPTPRQMAILQEGSVDFDAPIKELVGTYQFPVAVARGKGKISGKAKFANIDVGVYNDLFYGGTITSGSPLQLAVNEAHTATTTVTVTNSGTLVADQGVYDGTTGKFLTAMTSSAAVVATGQYFQSAGVYVFYSGDAGHPVQIDYTYTGTVGRQMSIANQLLGVQPTFSLVLGVSYNSQQMVLKLNQCVASKLSFGTKLEDFLIPDFAFSVFADSSNNIGSLSTPL